MKTYKTEKPFNNKYWDFYEEGIYVNSISGEPLFLSKDKYDSKTGWPAFSKTIDGVMIKRTNESACNMPPSVEVSSDGNHLGHVFKDGSTDTQESFCINSYSLKFISK